MSAPTTTKKAANELMLYNKLLAGVKQALQECPEPHRDELDTSASWIEHFDDIDPALLGISRVERQDKERDVMAHARWGKNTSAISTSEFFYDTIRPIFHPVTEEEEARLRASEEEVAKERDPEGLIDFILSPEPEKLPPCRQPTNAEAGDAVREWNELMDSMEAFTLGVGHIPYVPHSLRHGGATSDYLHGRTIEQIMFHGRWKSMESARRYIQTGRALLVTLDLPAHLHAVGLTLTSDLVPVLRALASSHPRVPAPLPVSPPAVRRVRFASDL